LQGEKFPLNIFSSGLDSNLFLVQRLLKGQRALQGPPLGQKRLSKVLVLEGLGREVCGRGAPLGGLFGRLVLDVHLFDGLRRLLRREEHLAALIELLQVPERLLVVLNLL